jgi:hypothetical protein
MSTQKAAEIAARFDRLPPSRTVWTMVIRIGSPGAAVLWTLRRKVPESPRWLARHGRIERASGSSPRSNGGSPPRKAWCCQRPSRLRRSRPAPVRTRRFLGRATGPAPCFCRISH